MCIRQILPLIHLNVAPLDSQKNLMLATLTTFENKHVTKPTTFSKTNNKGWRLLKIGSTWHLGQYIQYYIYTCPTSPPQHVMYFIGL